MVSFVLPHLFLIYWFIISYRRTKYFSQRGHINKKIQFIKHPGFLKDSYAFYRLPICDSVNPPRPHHRFLARIARADLRLFARMRSATLVACLVWRCPFDVVLRQRRCSTVRQRHGRCRFHRQTGTWPPHSGVRWCRNRLAHQLTAADDRAA